MASPFAGRWDLTVSHGQHSFPSWLELTECESGWLGRFVGEVGSARPITSISVVDSELVFSLPSQYEGFATDMVFKGKIGEGKIFGETNTKDGSTACWIGERAPKLPSVEPAWGDPVDLIQPGLVGWKARWSDRENFWKVSDSGLVNEGVGTDLVSAAEFSDFKLEAEYSYPEGSNSGIYLRGRYEIQILDDYGQLPRVGTSGGVYGFHSPSVNAVKPFGETNKAEITLLGRHLTIILNGVVIQDGVEIPGITGGALDSREGEPGPLLLQGDHGPVTFHKLILTPAK
jgi:hypothetical protein